ncbi:MAG: aromatic-ring-hydroxylating dioxygenase subunit beta [Rubrivivax sp.]|nr:aromatic-ring-hydroxylating dioxygenase subunit beta [Rubrivivax sp.]
MNNSAVKLDADTLLALHALYSDCAAVLDARELERWPDFFTEDGVYKLQSRENFDRGLPLATLALESRAMLKDRVYGAQETIFHDPYLQRHIVGLPRLLARESQGTDEVLCCEASYVVIRTKRDAMPEILSVGRYLDRVVHTPDGLRFAQRLVIFDNDLIPNSIIDPI